MKGKSDSRCSGSWVNGVSGPKACTVAVLAATSMLQDACRRMMWFVSKVCVILVSFQAVPVVGVFDLQLRGLIWFDKWRSFHTQTVAVTAGCKPGLSQPRRVSQSANPGQKPRSTEEHTLSPSGAAKRINLRCCHTLLVSTAGHLPACAAGTPPAAAHFAGGPTPSKGC